MRNPIGSALLQPLLYATALPRALLAEGAASVFAGCVTVTGANGANGGKVGGAGGAANAIAATSGDPSNCATATGGRGGSAEEFGGVGGVGGAASSTATTSIRLGAASADAASFGGTGGAGHFGGIGFPIYGGNGGPAGSSAAASSATGSASATASSTGGQPGYGPFNGSNGRFGSASADAAASSTGSGRVQADASAVVGGSGGSASASANAHNRNGKVLTTATALGAGEASALADAAVGRGSESLIAIGAGQAVSNAVLTPGGPDLGVGAMSAGYGGSSQALQYEATAIFDFTTTANETLGLNLLTDNFSGAGFDSLEFKVIVDGKAHVYKRSRLAGAESFFAADTLDLGTLAAGRQTIKLEYFLDYNSGTSAKLGAGFGFTYDLATAPVAATPATASEAAIASPLDILGGYETEFAEPSWTRAGDLNAFDSWSALASGAGPDPGGFGFHHENDRSVGGARGAWGISVGWSGSTGTRA
jgi:hypothetical protein